MEYRVTWEIDVTANSPREAAEQALTIQRDPDSTATVFEVRRVGTPRIDTFDVALRLSKSA